MDTLTRLQERFSSAETFFERGAADKKLPEASTSGDALFDALESRTAPSSATTSETAGSNGAALLAKLTEILNDDFAATLSPQGRSRLQSILKLLTELLSAIL